MIWIKDEQYSLNVSTVPYFIHLVRRTSVPYRTVPYRTVPYRTHVFVCVLKGEKAVNVCVCVHVCVCSCVCVFMCFVCALNWM